jgi:hypothetical protein
MWIDIAQTRSDPAGALKRIDESQRALADNYAMLARAVIAQAAVDLIACRYPRSMREYLSRWYRLEFKRRADVDDDMQAWLRRKQSELEEFFSNGGGELARAVDCYHYVVLARRGHVSYKRLRRLSPSSKG